MQGSYSNIVKNRELYLRTNDDDDNNDGDDDDDNNNNNNKYYKNLKRANSDYLHYLTRQWTQLHQCIQKWQNKIHKERGESVAQLHFNICKELGVKLNNKHWYDLVPQLVEQVMKVR